MRSGSATKPRPRRAPSSNRRVRAAIALTRNAVVTVDGLRNLAAEDDTVEL